VARFCKGEITKDELVAERYRMFEKYRKDKGSEFFGSKDSDTVDNLVKVAEAAALRYEHDESLVNILEGFEVRTGKANTNLDTEVKYNALEKAENWLAGKKLGMLVPSTALVAGATLVLSIGRVGSQKIINTATRFMVFTGGAAVFAGMRKNRELKEDRASDAIDVAEGRIIQGDDKKREALNKRYECVIPAKEATEQIKNLINPEKIANGGPNAVMDALTMLAATEARINESANRKIDLLSFSSQDSVIQERLELARIRSEAKSIINKNLTPEVKASLGISAEMSFGDILAEKTALFTSETIDVDVNEKDKAFNKYKSLQIAKAAATTLLVGAAVGVAFQEIKSIFDPNMTGVAERILGDHDQPINGEHHYTLLGGIGAKETIYNYNGKIITESLGGKGQANIPEGYRIDSSAKGYIDLIDSKGNGFKGLALDSEGKLSGVAIKTLEDAGLTVDQSKSFIGYTTVNSRIAANMTGDDYINQHPGAFNPVHRVDWENNNTEGISDKNELEIVWGGKNGTGITSQGSVQLRVGGMTPDGSYNLSGSVDPIAEIKDGNLFAVITASRDTQGLGIIVPVDTYGRINISPDSAAYGLFGLEDGKADYHGAFIEIIAKTEEIGDGGIAGHVLSTEVGENSIGTLPIDVIDHIETPVPIIDIIPGPTSGGVFFEMPPVIDLRGKEYMKPTESPVEAGYGYYNERELGSAEVESLKTETSPRLKDNPDANLVPAEEFSFYENLLVEKRGQAYVDSVHEIISKTPELASVSDETKIIVTIPVNAAGKSESENIYNVLTRGYGSQDPEGLKGTTILLHVNWFDSYGDNEALMRQNIEKTKSEIQRAKDELARNGVNIAVIETEYKRSEVQGGVIGFVARKMNDVALVALNSAITDGHMSKDHDVLLIRNDADVIGIRRHYLKRYKDEFESSSEPDVFMGSTSFDQTKAERLPGLVLSGNFMQSLDIIANSREGRVHTGGANFGVRASTFAAVGGLGFGKYSGAGSDDVSIGRRIKAGRSGKLSNSRNEQNNDSPYSEEYQNNQSGYQNNSGRVVGKSVYGARIDTNSDRGEREYGKNSIVEQWSGGNFSNNGYATRDDGLGEHRESFINGTDKVIRNITRDIEASIRYMGASNAVVRSALAFMLPKSNYYELSGSGKQSSFSITREGAEYLKNKMVARDENGKLINSYAKRKREWYGDNGAKRSTMIKI